jgi:hypothetical protein
VFWEIVCAGSTASIFGQARIKGLGLVNYRINVQDLAGVKISIGCSWTTTTQAGRCSVEATSRSGKNENGRQLRRPLGRTVKCVLIVETNANACAPVSARLLILGPIKLE